MADQADGSSSPAQDLIAGSALGLLVGLLIGMTTSSVVGSVVGSLVALIVALVGLNKDTSVIFTSASAVRLTAFSLVAAVALVAGVAIRTHDLLSPSPKALVAELTDAGYSADEARALARFRNFGLLPAAAQAAASDNPVVKASMASLFSYGGDQCNNLHRDQTLSVAERVSRLAGYGDPFSDVAARIRRLPDDRQAAMLDAAEFYLCGS